MRTGFLTLLACLLLSMSHMVVAYPDCYQDNCGPVACNPYESNCQCTDPACSRPWDSDCISRAACCEAFGNVGAR